MSEKFVALPEKYPELKLSTALGGKQKVWSVEIGKDPDGMFHLTGDGWRCFVEDHDLRLGYFLVFIYSSDVSFYVIPFDLSEFRIAYKPIQVQDTTTTPTTIDDSEPVVVVIDDDHDENITLKGLIFFRVFNYFPLLFFYSFRFTTLVVIIDF